MCHWSLAETADILSEGWADQDLSCGYLWRADQGPDPAEDCERSGGLVFDRIIAELVSGFLVNKILQAIFVRFSLRNVELSHHQLFLTWFSLAFMKTFYGSYDLHLS